MGQDELKVKRDLTPRFENLSDDLNRSIRSIQEKYKNQHGRPAEPKLPENIPGGPSRYHQSQKRSGQMNTNTAVNL